jgi:hypothetical protein
MRELILNDIEDLRSRDGFSSQTMRWEDFYWSINGIARISRNKAKQLKFIHLSETTRNDLSNMEDEDLLAVYHQLIRQQSKQM